MKIASEPEIQYPYWATNKALDLLKELLALGKHLEESMVHHQHCYHSANDNFSRKRLSKDACTAANRIYMTRVDTIVGFIGIQEKAQTRGLAPNLSHFIEKLKEYSILVDDAYKSALEWNARLEETKEHCFINLEGIESDYEMLKCGIDSFLRLIPLTEEYQFEHPHLKPQPMPSATYNAPVNHINVSQNSGQINITNSQGISSEELAQILLHRGLSFEQMAEAKCQADVLTESPQDSKAKSFFKSLLEKIPGGMASEAGKEVVKALVKYAPVLHSHLPLLP